MLANGAAFLRGWGKVPLPFFGTCKHSEISKEKEEKRLSQHEVYDQH